MDSSDDSQHTFDWEGTPPPDPDAIPELVLEEIPARRFSPRMLLGGAGLTAIAVVAAVVLVGGGGGGASGSPIALAADTTTSQPGYKFDMTVTATAGGQTINLNGSGAIDTGPPLSGSFTATVSGITVNERIVGTDLYVQSPTIGPQWEHISVAGLSGLGGGGSTSTQLTSADPAQMLDYLRASGTVTDEGSQTLNGVATTDYHADVDLSRYATTLPASQQAAAQQAVQAYEKATGSDTLPIDVWIDGSNLVRQIGLDLSIPSGSGDASVDLSMSLYDYGQQAPVSAPPAGDVTELPGQTPSTPSSTPSVPGSGASVPAASTNSPT